MGTIGDALDNAVAESFFATLQTELLDRGRWPTRRDLTAAIFSSIKGFYNRTRRYSTLGYLSPKDYSPDYHPAVSLCQADAGLRLDAGQCLFHHACQERITW